MKPGRVLIVDDEPELLKVLSTMMKQMWRSSRLWTARDGVDAVSKVLDLKPDLVMTDLRMPGRGGLELCRIVRGAKGLSGTKIVAMTAFHDARTGEQVLEYGADAYLPKPFTPDDLRRSIDGLFG
jgi:CheY-like chemotaxis protein